MAAKKTIELEDLTASLVGDDGAPIAVPPGDLGADLEAPAEIALPRFRVLRNLGAWHPGAIVALPDIPGGAERAIVLLERGAIEAAE